VLADDDRMLPGALTRAIGVLDAVPTVGMVHTTFQIIDDHGEVVHDNGNWTGRPIADQVERGAEFIARSMPLMARVCFPSVVMRTAALPATCFEAPDGTFGDYVLWLRIALAWDVAFLAAAGAAFRIHRGRLSEDAYGPDIGMSHAFRPDACVHAEAAKLRFITSNSERLPNVRSLRRAARRCTTREMALFVSMMANGGRADGVRAVRSVARERPRLLIAPEIWRAGVKVLVGPRTVRRLQRAMKRDAAQRGPGSPLGSEPS